MTINERYMDRIRGFDLLECLSPKALDELATRSATVIGYAPGELIYSQGQEDSFINYLLEGQVERTRNEAFESVIDYDKEQRTRPLDVLPQKPHTVHAVSPVTIVRFTRSELERAYQRATPDDRTGVVEVIDIGMDTTQDWHTRLLSSALFSHLAATNIQSIFDRMTALEAVAGQEIVRQGDQAGDYFVIQSGSCEVVRITANSNTGVHLANLGPGDGFGEESAISGMPRSASVRMSTDGRLMRMSRDDFDELVVRPLVRGVSFREANYLCEEGAVLVDTREPDEFRQGTINNAINVPFHLIRSFVRKLDKDCGYIICNSDRGRAKLGSFLFLERGFDASYLEGPVSRYAKAQRSPSCEKTNAPAPQADMEVAMEPETTAHLETTTMTTSNDSNGTGAANGSSHAATNGDVPTEVDRVPREEFADTTTGEELADIIDELYRQREEIEASDSFSLSSEESLGAMALESGAVDAAMPSGNTEKVVTDIISDIDIKLNQYIRQCIVNHQEALTQKLRAHAAQIERAAQEKVTAHTEQLRAHYEELYAGKEQKLREDYDRLTGVANKIAQQKAEIQKTRKTLTQMLQTANRVNQAVYRAGAELVQQVDHFGQVDGEENVH